MILRAKIGFNDLVAKCWRNEGDEWEADAERLESLKGTQWGDLAEEVKPAKQPRKRTPKAKADAEAEEAAE